MELKRVVVTGLGAVTPLGNTPEETWENMVKGVSGAAPITLFDATNFKTQFACEVKNWNPNEWIDRKDARKMDRYAQLAMASAVQGVKDSGLDLDQVDKNRVGVIYGVGIGGIKTFEEEASYYALNKEKGPRFSPFFIPKMIADIAAGQISIHFGFHGPNFTTTSACASSTNALADAFNLLRLGKADVIVAMNRPSLDKFEEHAGAKYDEDAQRLWARLLTGELNKPGSYSRKSMRILDDMEREDAEAFASLCARCAGGVLPWGERQQLLPLLMEKGQELALPESGLARLKGLGLIEFGNSSGFGMYESMRLGGGGWQVLKVGSRLLGVRFPEGEGFEVTVHRFTRYGEELSQLCDLGCALDRNDLLANKLKQAGGEVVRVMEIESDGRMRYVPL